MVLGLSHLSRTPEPPVGPTHSSPKLHLGLRAHTGPLYTHSINLSNQNRHMHYNKVSLHLCFNVTSSQYGLCDTISVVLLLPHWVMLLGKNNCDIYLDLWSLSIMWHYRNIQGSITSWLWEKKDSSLVFFQKVLFWGT